jgi:hypothetical protein
MRKSSQKRTPAAKVKQHRAKKDTALAVKRKKEVCHSKETAISGNHTEIHSPIGAHSKDERGENFAAPEKKTPAIDCQKLLTACPEEPAKAQATEAGARNQIASFVTRSDLEVLEKTAAAIEQQVRVYVEKITSLEIALLKEKTERIAAEQKARMYAQKLAQLQEQLKARPESEEINGVCNCCGRTDVPEENLVKIDSGQRMCPACLGELMGLSPGVGSAS